MPVPFSVAMGMPSTLFGVGDRFRRHPGLARLQRGAAAGRLGQVCFFDASVAGTICDQDGPIWTQSFTEAKQRTQRGSEKLLGIFSKSWGEPVFQEHRFGF